MNQSSRLRAVSRRVGVLLHLAVALAVGPAAAQSVLHSFSGMPLDGSAPSSQGLAFDGTYLYGTTATGGTSNIGTVFRIAPDGSGYAVLADLAGAPGPVTPRGGVVNDGARLYGVSAAGGANGAGTVYALNFDGSGLVVLHDFQGSPFDLSGPQSRLLVVGATLFGTASGGGTSGCGGIYSLATAGGSYAVHADLAGGMGGCAPTGELTSDGTRLYGMIPNGGTASSGYVYTLNLDGSGFSTLYDLAGGTSEGAAPAGGLVWSSEFGMFFGLTSAGGANGVGVVFAITDIGFYYPVHDFAGSPFDGAGPTGSLALAGDVLYGTTASGGASNAGTLFTIELGGPLEVLAEFPGAPGPVAPAGGGAPLMIGNDLFGLSQAGGASNLGALYVVQLNDVPVANDDLFATYVDMPLSVPSPGVLTNDTDGDLQPLTVYFADSITSLGGSVYVASDGSFDYWPPFGTPGLDTFTYSATDGIDGSSSATVTVDLRTGMIVTSFNDDGVNGTCSLREAITAANTDLAVDACPAGIGADVILLPPGTYTLTLAGSNEDGNATGDLDITAALTLVGSGALATTVDATELGDRAFHVDPLATGAFVSIQAVKVTGGSLTVSGAGARARGGGRVKPRAPR